MEYQVQKLQVNEKCPEHGFEKIQKQVNIIKANKLKLL